jgi:hypothetical protein
MTEISVKSDIESRVLKKPKRRSQALQRARSRQPIAMQSRRCGRTAALSGARSDDQALGSVGIAADAAGGSEP